MVKSVKHGLLHGLASLHGWLRLDHREYTGEPATEDSYLFLVSRPREALQGLTNIYQVSGSCVGRFPSHSERLNLHTKLTATDGHGCGFLTSLSLYNFEQI